MWMWKRRERKNEREGEGNQKKNERGRMVKIRSLILALSTDGGRRLYAYLVEIEKARGGSGIWLFMKIRRWIAGGERKAGFCFGGGS